jgi:PTH1 family peptidyl-tRNA hydrolase
VLAAIPDTFMNESGVALGALVRRHSLDPSRIVIVHDELDLPVGVVRVKSGGGTAGHNGLRSIEAHLRTLDFLRVRIGIGKPPGQMKGADYVLRRPPADEREILDVAIERASDAIGLVITRGIDAAMNTLNMR